MFRRQPFVRVNQGIVGCAWFVWRVVEQRYWWEYGNVKNKNKLVE